MRRLYILSLFSFLFTVTASAQVSPSAPWSSASNQAQTSGTKPPPTPPSGSPTTAPIDGGLGILLVAGVAYGSRRYRAQKRTGTVTL